VTLFPYTTLFRSSAAGAIPAGQTSAQSPQRLHLKGIAQSSFRWGS
jgi:hypothetical protein